MTSRHRTHTIGLLSNGLSPAKLFIYGMLLLSSARLFTHFFAVDYIALLNGNFSTATVAGAMGYIVFTIVACVPGPILIIAAILWWAAQKCVAKKKRAMPLS